MSDRTDEQRRTEEDVRRREDGDDRLTTSDLVREADEVDEDEHSVAADRMNEHGREPLFEAGDTQGFRDRWLEIQAAFVDEPRRAVHEADTLVAELMQQLARTFADERSSLEAQWDREEDVSTEDLRLALQRYRSFFDRLLSV